MNNLLLKADRKGQNDTITLTDKVPKNSVSISLDIIDKNGFSVRYGRVFKFDKDFSPEKIQETLTLLCRIAPNCIESIIKSCNNKLSMELKDV
jgi:hypothetical protein